MMKRPFFWIGLFWLIGTAAAVHSHSPHHFVPNSIGSWSILLGAAALPFVLARWNGWSSYAAAMLSLLVIFSFLYTQSRDPVLSHSYYTAQQDGQTVKVGGVIEDKPAVDGDHFTFTLRSNLPEDECFHVSITLQTKQEKTRAERWERGRGVFIQGTLLQPSTDRNRGEFNYRRYLAYQHTSWILYVKGLTHVQRRDVGSKSTSDRLMKRVDRLRSAVDERIARLYSEPTAAFMQGLLVGDRSHIDPQSYLHFSELGLTHLLAISGLHVGLFAGLLLFLFRLFRLTREQGLKLAMLLLPAYIILTGASPSAVRAGIMAEIGMVLALNHRFKDGLSVLSLTAILMLLWQPFDVVNVSFQLSFMMTAGLILGVPRMSRLLPKMPQWLNGLLSVTWTAQIVSFPLMVYYFHSFSLLSWAANLLIVPIAGMLILPLGGLSLLLSCFSLQLGEWAAWLPEHAVRGGLYITSAASHLFWSQTYWRQPAVWWIVGYYALWAGLLYFTDQRLDYTVIYRRNGTILGKWVSLLVLAVLIITAYEPSLLDRRGEVEFLDVGQGDAALIRTPNGKHILIDGGGTLHFPKQAWQVRTAPYDVGTNLLVPLLKERGIHVLDMVIASHDDEDHVGGLRAVLDQLPVKQFVFNGTMKDDTSNIKLFQEVVDRRIPLMEVESNQVLQVDAHTRLQFILPPRLLRHASSLRIDNKQNNQSLVCLLQMYDSTFMFTGDMEQPEEQEILHALAPAVTRIQTKMKLSLLPEERLLAKSVDVLKVAHHGSKTSSSEAWLEYWKPRLAVISVGARNHYGQPAPSVLERLGRHKIRVFRTDKNGEVYAVITSKGVTMHHRF